MSLIKRFEDIEAWQMGRLLCHKIGKLTNIGDFQQDYSLKDQIRRASGSIMDNIAEGFGRDGNREFIQYLSCSKGSANEVQSQLYRALDFGYINQKTFDELYLQVDHVIGKITNFMKYLAKSDNKGVKYSNRNI